jgi:hypothetical protein
VVSSLLPGNKKKGPTMNKKMMLLALVMASAALFALPAAASAQEAHIEGITAFTGTGGASSLVASGEPTLTCESVDVTNGVINAGGTTGSMVLDFTGCHKTVGFTLKCRTAGSPLDNTIRSSGTFHVITINNKPAVLVTPVTTEIICAGVSNTHLEGNGIIGTITAPECGVFSKTLTVAFSATSSTQNHITYTSVAYDLKSKTSGGSSLTAGLTQTATLTSSTAGNVNCT